MVQLRDKAASEAELLAAAPLFARACDEHGALFWLNDRPDLARRCGADGVHVGQDDMPVAEARRAAGDELLVGLSTHSPAQLDEALELEADQLERGTGLGDPHQGGARGRGTRLRPLRGRPRRLAPVVRDRRHRAR